MTGWETQSSSLKPEPWVKRGCCRSLRGEKRHWADFGSSEHRWYRRRENPAQAREVCQEPRLLESDGKENVRGSGDL